MSAIRVLSRSQRVVTPPEATLRLHRVPVRWRTRIETWDPPHRFVDVKIRGPYRSWHHTHCFAAEDSGTAITDTVRYSMPFGPLGEIAHRLLVRRDLERIFAFRQEAVARLLGEGPGSSAEGSVAVSGP